MVVNITTTPNGRGLACTSTGGPATAVVWKINNLQMLITSDTTYHQSQRIVSTEDATFENMLQIPSDSIANYEATYECLVMNSVGNDSMSKTLEGKWIIATDDLS